MVSRSTSPSSTRSPSSFEILDIMSMLANAEQTIRPIDLRGDNAIANSVTSKPTAMTGSKIARTIANAAYKCTRILQVAPLRPTDQSLVRRLAAEIHSDEAKSMHGSDGPVWQSSVVQNS